MRFMVLMRSTKNTEAGVLPDEKLLTEMGKFNEELMKSGMLLAGEGLHPSAKGARVRWSRAAERRRRAVRRGEGADRRLLASRNVTSKEEALAWIKRIPMGDDTMEVELRQVFEPDDFGPAFTPELREAEERLRQQAAAKA